jgi:putative oxidoreductase
MKRYLPPTLRVLLGLVFLGANLAPLLMGMQPPPGYPPDALAFSEALMKSGYLTYLVMAVEVVSAVLLLLNLWTPLVLVVLAPVTLNILLFHVFLTPKILVTIGGLGILVFVLNVALLWLYRGHYRHMLTRRARLD